MRIKTRFSAGLCAALLGVGSALAQTPPATTPTTTSKPTQADPADKDGSLEKALAEALSNNPDVRVAESKLREAEAELARARMHVMQKVVAIRGGLDVQRAAVKTAEAYVKRITELAKHKAVAEEEVLQAQQKLAAAKAQLAQLENESGFLLGRHKMQFRLLLKPDGTVRNIEGFLADGTLTSQGGPARGGLEFHLRLAAPGSTGDKLRKALDKTVSFDFKERSLEDVLKEFQEAHGVPFVLASRKLGETKVSLKLAQASFGAALEMIEDTVPGVHFAARDYGVLVTSAERLPAGAVPIYTFWKSTPPGPAVDVLIPKQPASR